MAAQKIEVPDIGETDEVEVIEVLVAEGDTVENEQALITLESDKATLEVPATQAGRITDLTVSEGDTVSKGDVIALVEAAGEDADLEKPLAVDSDEKATGESSNTKGSKEYDAESDDSKDEDTGGDEAVEIKVPDIGDFDEVEIIEVLVAVGDAVDNEEPLITLESDKATLEVPASAAGTIRELKVSEGVTVSEGDVIARISVSETIATSDRGQSVSKRSPKELGTSLDDAGQDDTGQSSADNQSAKSSSNLDSQGGHDDSDSSKLASINENRFGKAHAPPSVRRYARELGVDIGRINGSGAKGRISFEDIRSFVKTAVDKAQSSESVGTAPAGNGGVPNQPDIDFSQFGEFETVELERIRKISAKAVHKNWLLIPHVTQFDTADITEMEEFRQVNKEKAKADGVKLTPMAFLLKASAAALKTFPDLNSSLTADGASLVHKKYVNIAVAIDTPNGLLMPVIKDVDKKGIYEIARDLDDVSGRARDGKIKGNDMQGACFSISSLGGVGGTAFTPIVNSPEVGILGVSKHSWQPVWNGKEFEPRLILPLSFSYDHRVIDGAKAARVTRFFSERLTDLRALLL